MNKHILLPFEENGLAGLCDVDGNVVVEPRFRDADKSQEGVVVAKTIEEDLVLLHADTLETITLEGWTDNTSYFSYGLLAVQEKTDSDSPVGFIDRQGKFVIKPQFHIARDFDQFGVTVEFERGSKCQQRINRKGEVVGSPFMQIGFFHQGGTHTGAEVQHGFTGHAVINHKAEQISDNLYLKVWSENEGLIPVDYDGETVGWLNSDGVELRRFSGYHIGSFFQNGLVPLQTFDDKWGLIDLEENWILEPDYDYIEFLSDSRLALGHYPDGDPEELPVVYLADMAGNRIGEATGDYIGQFEEDGIATIYRPNADLEIYVPEVNYIDKDGKLLLNKWYRGPGHRGWD